MSRILVALMLIATVAVPGATPAFAAKATPPPTLQGVQFHGLPTFSNVVCNPNGTSSFEYQVSGTTSGSYEGTFSEQGTVTIGAQTLPQAMGSGPYLIEWTEGATATAEATFTIDAPRGRVTGTRTLNIPGLQGACQQNVTANLAGVVTTLSAELERANGNLSYSARISVGRKTYCDTGLSSLSAAEFVIGAPLGETVERSYASTFSSPWSSPTAVHGRGGC